MKKKHCENSLLSSRKACLAGRQGFTLVELLLVMAIVGILSGVLMAGISSSRKRAKMTSALKTANSVKVELAQCYLNGIDSNVVVGTDPICLGSGNWPSLGATGCSYTSYNTGSHVLTISCPSNNNATINCDISEGECHVTY